MRLTFLGHACHLLEIDGKRILSDPWLCDPIFGGFVERNPSLGFGVGDLPALDAVTLSHGHLDHFNAPALARLPDKSIPVIHPPVLLTELDDNLRRLGFTNLHARDDFEPFELDGVRIVPTPSRGVLDECAFFIGGRGGTFWNGVDAPQPPEVIEEIRARLGEVEIGAFSHNSFDQPALLGIDSHKDADHAPRSATVAARILGVKAAVPAASNMRWRGKRGEEVTRKVIRRSHDDFRDRLAEGAPEVEFLDLQPGDAWSRDGGFERTVVTGTGEDRVESDYIHTFLETGERWCPPGRPSTEETFRVHLPVRMRAARDVGAYLGQRMTIRIVGEDPGEFTVDFRDPEAAPVVGPSDEPFAVEVLDHDWKDLFERRISWQVLLVSDRLKVLRFRPGPPPDGLHFAYALQAVFP